MPFRMISSIARVLQIAPLAWSHCGRAGMRDISLASLIDLSLYRNLFLIQFCADDIGAAGMIFNWKSLVLDSDESIFSPTRKYRTMRFR